MVTLRNGRRLLDKENAKPEQEAASSQAGKKHDQSTQSGKSTAVHNGKIPQSASKRRHTSASPLVDDCTIKRQRLVEAKPTAICSPKATKAPTCLKPQPVTATCGAFFNNNNSQSHHVVVPQFRPVASGLQFTNEASPFTSTANLASVSTTPNIDVLSVLTVDNSNESSPGEGSVTLSPSRQLTEDNWPDIGSTLDALKYSSLERVVQPVSTSDNCSFRPLQMFCQESLDSPSLQRNRDAPLLNFISTTIEPIKSSPMLQSATAPLSGFALDDSGYWTAPAINKSKLDDNCRPGSTSDIDSDDCDQAEPDYLEHFTVITKKSKNAGKRDRKWLEFICSTIDFNRQTRDGLASPHERQPDDPRTLFIQSRESFLAEIAKGQLEEGCVAWEMLESYKERHSYMPELSCQKFHQNSSFRAVLVNWLMEVSNDMSFQRQTLQTAINFLDRFYARTEHLDSDLHQILAAAALYIAAKKEEVEPPTITRMLTVVMAPKLTACQFGCIAVKMMEVLRWDLTPPTYLDWLCLYLRIAALIRPALFHPKPCNDPSARSSKEGVDMGMYIRTDLFREAIYLIDVYTHAPESVRYEPGRIAALALWVACKAKMCESLSDDDLQSLIMKCSGWTAAAFDGMDSLTRLHSQKECLPLATYNPCVEGRADVDYFQPEYPDLANFLSSLDNVPLNEDADAGYL